VDDVELPAIPRELSIIPRSVRLGRSQSVAKFILGERLYLGCAMGGKKIVEEELQRRKEASAGASQSEVNEWVNQAYEDNGMTPLMVAQLMEKTEIIRLLVRQKKKTGSSTSSSSSSSFSFLTSALLPSSPSLSPLPSSPLISLVSGVTTSSTSEMIPPTSSSPISSSPPPASTSDELVKKFLSVFGSVPHSLSQFLLLRMKFLRSYFLSVLFL